MADRKEYEVLFGLNARMNSGFSSTFSRAKAEFAQLGSEIQNLQKVQANISGYQKQQAAVDKTAAKLDRLKKEEQLMQQELNAARAVQTSTSEAARAAAASMGAESDKAKELALEAQRAAQNTAHLEREHQRLSDRIKDTDSALERQRERLRQTGEALQAAGVSTDNLERESRELAQQLEALHTRQAEVASGAQTFGDQAANAIETVGQAVAAAGIANAFGEIKDGFLQAVNVSKDFSASMSNVEALSGASASEIAALNAQAKELGATTQFTAKQSADAMGYMAMAGWNPEQMMSGMDGVLSAAAASGEDLAMVSDIVTDSMSAFQMGAEETGHFSDVLAAAAANANTSIGIMGETFKGSASVAGALGYSIEDVAVATGLMANVGVKGSIANTALRNTFNGLLGGVTLTGKAFGEYEYTAIKADGSMKSLGDTINELRGYFEQMTESERVLNAQEIAGERGYNGLLGVLMASEESYENLTEKINNCEGAAARMAKIKMDNLHGDILLAESAWEGFQIAVGEKATPAMRMFYQVQADVLSGMGELVDAHPALAQGIMTTTGLFLGATTAVTGLSAAIKVFKALDVASLFMGPAGLALKIGAGVAVAAGGVVALTSAYREQVPSVRELTEASREMQETLDAGAAAYEDTMAETLAAANAADVYISKLEQMGDIKSIDASGAQEYKNILSLLAETIPELADGINLQTGEIDGGTAALRANTAAWQENAKAKAYQDYYTEMYKQEADLTLELEKNKVGLTKATIAQEEAERKLEVTRSRMVIANGEGDYEEYYRLESSLDALNHEYNLAGDTVKTYQQAVADGEAALADYRITSEDTRQAIENLTSATEDSSTLSAETTAQMQGVKTVMDEAGASLLSLAERYNEVYDAAYESISGQYSLWDKAAEVEAVSAGSINSALESQINYWRQYDSNIDALTVRAGAIEGLSEMIASFADGSADSVNAIAGMAKANDGDLKKMVENWQTLQKEQKTTSESLAQMNTDFQGELDQILEYTQSTIAAMNLSEEARQSAEATMQAFAGAAKDQMPIVQSAFNAVAAGAMDSFNRALSNRPSISGTLNIGLANVKGSFEAIGGFASGTPNAPPGWAWVGEEGPELMYLHGGETILPASVSEKVADIPWHAFATSNAERGPVLVGENGPEPMYTEPKPEPLYALDGSSGQNSGSTIINLTLHNSPTYNIGDSPNKDTLMELLNNLTVEQGEKLAELILDVLADHERNKALEDF